MTFFAHVSARASLVSSISVEAPGEPYPVPDPGDPYPVPDPGEPYPAPDPGEPYPAPDPGEPYPAPDPGEPYPVPDPRGWHLPRVSAKPRPTDDLLPAA